jgi:predicted N-formylglutamate amidohydrolase
MKTELLISCEHAGNEIPLSFAALFKDCRELLRSHRGYDPGALEIARSVAAGLRAPLFFETISRLLVEQNRSRDRAAVFSSISRKLPVDQREQLLKTVYDPYHEQIERAIGLVIGANSRIVHLSMHTFTPVLDGVRRNADIGLLYDPRRIAEKSFCARLQSELDKRYPSLRIRKNYPYRGTSDGLTTGLRNRFPENRYLGIEIEINQHHYFNATRKWEVLLRDLPDCIGSVIN